MDTTLAWAAVALVIGVLVTWRMDRQTSVYLRTLVAKRGDDELTIRERTLQVELAEAIAPEVQEHRRAELRKQTAELDAAVEMDKQLEPDRLEASRRVIAADAEAREALAEEFARTEHTARSGRRNAKEDVIDMYARYTQTMVGTANTLSFSDFLETMEEHGHL